VLTKDEISRLSDEFESKTPQEILTWAIDEFWPQIAMSSSFQTQSMPLLHMATLIRRDLLIFFLDTGYHFWDTLTFRESIASNWKLNVLDLYRDSRWDVFARQNVRALPVEDPDLCCYLHKVQPMQKALKDLKAWISGIRRDQTIVRAKARILELQDNGLLKINPLLNWTKADVERYMEEHDLPVHPLSKVGFRSIGCAPCTEIVSPAEQDDRAGRWVGRGKTECGLHTDMFQKKDISELGRNLKLNISDLLKKDQ
jgi:phosphoadenosine phosphosulfate reductase